MMPLLSRLWTTGWTAGLLLLHISCSERPREEWKSSSEGLSLVEIFGGAETAWQVRSIDVGKPEARRFLGDGWGYDEKGRLRDAVWALGERSTLNVFLSKPTDVGLYLDVQRLDFDDLPPQEVTVEVNGVEVGTVVPAKDFGTPGRVTASAELWREGLNVVSFRHSVTAIPSLHSKRRDGRPLSTSCNGVALRGLASSSAPTVTEPGDNPPALHLPHGSQVSYFLRLQPGAELLLPRIEGAGRLGGPGRLKVLLAPASSEGESTSDEREWSVASGKADVRLGLTDQQGLYRLTLRSLAKPAVRVGKRGLTLVDPRIASTAAAPPGTASKPSERTEPRLDVLPNVLLYVIDTLRADHVGAYGNDKGTTPNLDALAADGILFEHARAHSSWTRPTVASILTGLHPLRHGTGGERDGLSAEVGYLPELLGRAGYRTAAVITNGVVSGQFGFDRGFDSFTYLGERPETDPRIHQGAEVLNQAALDWLSSLAETQAEADGGDRTPFFLYLHATDPHAPYRPPEVWRERFAPGVDPTLGDHARVSELEWNPAAVSATQSPSVAENLIALYDAEIAFLDHQFGRFVKRLKEAGLYDDLLIVVLSDHGEEFGDHGRWQHGMTLNEEQLRVPLIVKPPARRGGIAGTRVEHVVEQMDVAPTILNLAGLSAQAEEMQGVDLLRSVHGPVPPRSSLAVLSRHPNVRHVESILSGGRKLIHYRAYDRARSRSQLFELTTDPGERHDLASELPVWTGFLRGRLRLAEILWRPAAVDCAHIDEELERSLRAVGYLD